jgi:4-aminobutyrate aminotransferase-like enzyme
VVTHTYLPRLLSFSLSLSLSTPFTHPHSRYKLTIDSGKGCFLKTTDGKNYLDCVSGIATCALGHNNDYLTKAIQNQMKKVHHVSNLYFIPEQAALANWLCTNSGADKAFFCNSGAEANEAAIKVARRHAYNRGITVRANDAFCLDVWSQSILYIYICIYISLTHDILFSFSFLPTHKRNRSLFLPNNPFTDVP